MAYSEKLSDFVVLEKCEVYAGKSQYSLCISLNLSKKGNNSVKSLKMTPKSLELDLYFMMLNPFVSFNDNGASL